jgi:hypothetical protein
MECTRRSTNREAMPMIQFSCPKCQTPYTVSDQAAGQSTTCENCGQQLAGARAAVSPAPPLAQAAPVEATGDPFSNLSGWTEPTDTYMQRVRRSHNIHAARYALVGIGLLVVGWLLFFRGSGILAPPPDTCAGVAERLRGRGVDIRWVTMSRSKEPAIYIIRNNETMIGANEPSLDERTKAGNWVDTIAVVQYNSDKEAREAAESRKREFAESRKHESAKNAFAWGRYLFAGDSVLIDDAKEQLGLRRVLRNGRVIGD